MGPSPSKYQEDLRGSVAYSNSTMKMNMLRVFPSPGPEKSETDGSVWSPDHFTESFAHEFLIRLISNVGCLATLCDNLQFLQKYLNYILRT